MISKAETHSEEAEKTFRDSARSPTHAFSAPDAQAQEEDPARGPSCASH